MTKNMIAILTGPPTILDHLGVLSAYLDVPLIVTDERTFELGQSFYPKTQLILKDMAELSLDYLTSHFDIILQSGRSFSFELETLMSPFYKKNVRFVYCPHGNSDKGHTFKKEEYPAQDISLVYGDHMIDLLKRSRLLEKINATVTTGNYRYPYYLENKEFYDKEMDKLVFSKLDPKKKTILYAPTCNSREYASSFFTFCSDLIEQNKEYNLIVKPHPYLEHHFPAQTWHLLAKYENHPNTTFLVDFPPIYPLLEKVDIYLGDFSSIGYDFLTFNRPMYFFNTARTDDPQGKFLHRCGIQIADNNDIYRFIEENLEKNLSLSSIREATYAYTFAPTVSTKNLRQALIQLAQ